MHACFPPSILTLFACEPDFGLREGLTARWFRGRVGQGADVTSGGPSPLTAYGSARHPGPEEADVLVRRIRRRWVRPNYEHPLGRNGKNLFTLPTVCSRYPSV